ncbi:MAG: GNAT family N-acetyltransferase [Anaerolineae bacterium]|jgi:CelD/BcsL family acetyltransferase involved in cellulose biosynthesis|nr:GNAT family N-acetyltransferase [Anaerolineae bacterium]MBT7069400.1 GNAT family N-acetyltransferase [Anaerolineae bacterium]MBT7325364.1 GNAT family N-acetyltransferase [Anaerolineae bacterium]
MKYTLSNTLEEFEKLALEWNSLLAESIANLPFLRHEYLLAWWDSLGGGEWEQGELAIITAERDGELIGIAPLFSTIYEDQPSLLFLGSIEISDFLDFIVREADLADFISGLLDFLASHTALTWSALDLQNLVEDSPSLPVLQTEAASRGWNFAQETLQPSPYVALPGSFDEYLAGVKKKQRHEIRRKMRRATADEREVTWYIVDDETKLDKNIEAFCQLMTQDPEKQAFLTQTMKSQMNAAIHAAFDAGWLQLAFLEVDGEKAAGYLNFDYDNRIWVYNSGLDMKFRDLSPGWVLLGYLLQWANENSRSEFDFMRGDESYKYKFGGVDRFVVRAKLSQ